MAEEWLLDVKKYVPDCDETVVAGIVRYCGIALRNRDSSLVSYSDQTELDRVRNNFLKKKLALTDSDDVLNAAIAKVGETLKGVRNKNRVTVYYLLSEHFGMHHLFGGSAGSKVATSEPDTDTGNAGAAVAAGVAGIAGVAAAGASAAGDTASAAVDKVQAIASDVGDAAASAAHRATDTVTGAVGAAGAAGAAALAGLAGGDRADASSPGYGGGGASYADAGAGSSGFRWWPWLLLALALLALFFLLRSCKTEPVAVVADNVAINTSVEAANIANAAGALANDAGNVAVNAAAALPPVPVGSAVVAEVRNGLPALNVYFDSGKAVVASEFAAKAAEVKAYVESHPGAKLSVSGFNDPTGNAALNAELSKNRARNVGAALQKLGISADAVVLEKPAETTIANTDKASARRVEVTIKQ